MDTENIESGAPIAGSPDLRALVGEPAELIASAAPAARRPDISFADAANEAEYS